MEWVYLIVAGGLEVFWSTCLKLSEGFSVLRFSILTVIGMIFSFLFLSQATKTLPLGTSYAIWTGIGCSGCRDRRRPSVQGIGFSAASDVRSTAPDRNHRS